MINLFIVILLNETVGEMFKAMLSIKYRTINRNIVFYINHYTVLNEVRQMMVLVMLSPLLVVGFIVMAILEEKKRNRKK